MLFLRSLPATFAALGALYVALSPRVALPLYNTKLFHPDKYPLGDFGVERIEGIQRQDVFFTSTNGNQLHGWYFKVPGTKKTLLFNHGNAGNLTHRVPALSLLFEAGVSVFIYDYQGYGRSSGSPSLPGICQDGLAAFDYLVTQEGIRPQDILIYGESLGSGVACQVSAMRGSAGLILQSGFSSLRRIGCEVLPVVGFYPNWLFPKPDLDNISMVSRGRCPLLIMHGLRDLVVPFTHAEELYLYAAEPKIFVPLPEAGHSDISVSEPNRYTQGLKDFLSTLDWHRPWCYMSRPVLNGANQRSGIRGT